MQGWCVEGRDAGLVRGGDERGAPHHVLQPASHSRLLSGSNGEWVDPTGNLLYVDETGSQVQNVLSRFYTGLRFRPSGFISTDLLSTSLPLPLSLLPACPSPTLPLSHSPSLPLSHTLYPPL